MPSDQDESRAVLQQTNASEWIAPGARVPSGANDSSNEDDQFANDQFIDQFTSDQFRDQFAEDQLVEEAVNTDNLMAPDTESDLLQWSTPPPLVSKEALGTFWRQFAPILVPLPFGLLIFGATLPATLQGSSADHPSVWIMAILLLALMILQGTLLYFAGSNDTLLTLYIVGGYTLFVVAGIFAAFGTMPALFTLGILVIVGLLLARRGIHPTREGHVDIVTSFGKYAQTLEPGLNLLLPWERVEYSLNTQETTWTTPKMEVMTTRDQKVELTATVSYQLMPEDAHLAATNVKNWEASLQALFRGTVQSMINELTLADFVTWTQSIYIRPANNEASSFNPAVATRWDRINNTLSRRMQDQVATWGVQINWVRIQDLTPLPITSGIPAAHLNGHTGGSTQIMKHEMPAVQATSPAPQRLARTESTPAPAQPTTPEPAAPPPSTPAAPKSGKPPRVEILVDTYDAVRMNVITDPKLIIQLAQHFEALASDPVASKNIEFDAARAAQTLRQRAQQYENMASTNK
jgi:hypothetical protein